MGASWSNLEVIFRYFGVVGGNFGALEALKSTPEAPKSTPEVPEGHKRGARIHLYDFGSTPGALVGGVFDLKFVKNAKKS